MVEKHYPHWELLRRFDDIQLTIKGHSRGSEKTGFYIPELRMFLDAGIQSLFEPKHIFITHCHCDHSYALGMLITGINTSPTIYVPIEHLKLFKNYLDTVYQLANGDFSLKDNHKLIGVLADDKIHLTCSHYIKIYDLYHRVPTRGCGIHRIVNKLKDEYKGLSSSEIRKIKKSGTEIVSSIDQPLLIYLTDTNKRILNNNEIYQYKYIMVECTFILDKDYDKAEQCGHIHWKDLEPIIDCNPNITFILIHFALRYRTNEIKEFFKDNKKDNVILWL
jgi:ribonuclease Z